MGGYIGSRSVVLSTTAANVQDVTATDTTPEVTIVNTTHEDTDGGREGKVIFKGQQSGGEETTLAEIQGSHDGASDDEKGDLIFKTNDGSDGASPTERLRIDSDGSIITATLGTDNVHLGEGAGAAIVSGGNNNVAIGKDAGTALTLSDNNVAVGYQALMTEDTTIGSTALGYRALKTQNLGSDGYNVALGHDAGTGLTTGISNTLIGGFSGGGATLTGSSNTAVGRNSLYVNTSGASNVAIGAEALTANTTASQNTAVGYQAGYANTTGDANVVLGSGGLAANTTGGNNVAIGNNALTSQTSPNINIGIGSGAGGEITSGAANICIGYISGRHGVNLQTGNYNVLVGHYTDTTATGTNYANGFGYNITADGGYTTIGADNVDIRAEHGVATWATVSDERYKKDIVDSQAGLSLINALRPRTFNYKTHGELPETFKAYEEGSTKVFKSSQTQHGFIAQEVKAAMDADSGVKDGFKLWDDREDGSQEVAEAALIPVLVKALQELSAKNDALEAQNTTQATQIADLITRVTALEAE